MFTLGLTNLLLAQTTDTISIKTFAKENPEVVFHYNIKIAYQSSEYPHLRSYCFRHRIWRCIIFDSSCFIWNC